MQILKTKVSKDGKSQVEGWRRNSHQADTTLKGGIMFETSENLHAILTYID